MKSRAIFFKSKGTAEIREIDIPDPAYDEIQARTLVNGICMGEVWLYNGVVHENPRIVGHEGVGIVTRVGAGVQGIFKGDFITTRHWSEYTNQRVGTTVKLSCTMENYESYLIEPSSCAVNAAAYLDPYPGDRVLVFGAGYMGLLLIQLLRRYPLSQLIVIDMKQENLKLAKMFGATETLDISTEDGKKRIEELQKKPFDITIEASGATTALDQSTKCTRTGGKLGLYAWHHQARSIDTSEWHMKGLQVLNVSPFITSEDRPLRSFEAADRLNSCGVIQQSQLITHKYTLDEITQAMEESTTRGTDFIKSILIFNP